nr:DUF4062 domain-containing protein [Paenibacillus sp. RC67]
MRKKLQVFLSSTFNDLIEERHAAVQAVLKAGHIPAGEQQRPEGDTPPGYRSDFTNFQVSRETQDTRTPGHQDTRTPAVSFFI